MQKPGQKEAKLDKQVTMTQMAGRQGAGCSGPEESWLAPRGATVEAPGPPAGRSLSGLKCRRVVLAGEVKPVTGNVPQ